MIPITFHSTHQNTAIWDLSTVCLVTLQQIMDGAKFGWVETGVTRKGTRINHCGYYMVNDKRLTQAVGKELEEYLHWDEEKSCYRLSTTTRLMLTSFTRKLDLGLEEIRDLPYTTVTVKGLTSMTLAETK